jgi:hypothetical protein
MVRAFLAALLMLPGAAWAGAFDSVAPGLPLSGGTLSGPLAATTGTFDGAVTANNAGANPVTIIGTNINVTGSGNPTLAISSGGTGAVQLKTSGGIQFAIADGGASTVNSVRVTGGATGIGPTIQAVGETTVTLNLAAGTGGTGGTINLKAFQTNVGEQISGNRTYVTGVGIGPGTGVNKPMFWNDVAIAGVVDTGTGLPNYLRVRDTVSAGTLPGGFNALFVDQELNAGFDGGRQGMQIIVNKTATSTSGTGGTANNGFTALQVFGHYDVGEGGSNGNSQGAYMLFNPDIRCGGLWLASCAVSEHDLRLVSGASAGQKVNQILHYGVGDAVHGTNTDAVLIIDASPTIGPGTGRGLNLIQLSQIGQAWPLDPTQNATSSILTTVLPGNSVVVNGFPVQYYAGYGVDLKNVSLTNYAWRSTGHWVDNVGNLLIGPSKLSYANAGLTISSPNFTEVSAVAANAGQNYTVGDELVDAAGGQWTVATLGASNGVATVTRLNPGFPTACPGAGAAVTGGTGTSATLTITCSASGNVTFGSGTDKVGFYGHTPVAQPIAAVTLADVIAVLHNNGLTQ